MSNVHYFIEIVWQEINCLQIMSPKQKTGIYITLAPSGFQLLLELFSQDVPCCPPIGEFRSLLEKLNTLDGNEGQFQQNPKGRFFSIKFLRCLDEMM